MRIGILIDWYEPAYLAGGPIKSIKNLAYLLKDDNDIHIIAGNTDLRSHEAMKDVSDGLVSDSLEGKVYFLKRGLGFSGKLKKLLLEIDPDILYINGIYSRYFSLLPMVLASLGILPFRKLVISPRGMLRSGSVNVKPRRKKAVLFILKKLVVKDTWYWHATDEQEAIDIKKRLGVSSERITIAGNVPAAPKAEISTREIKSPLKLVLISRLSPEKNIDGLLKSLAMVTQEVHLDIYGDFQSEAYREKVGQCILKLPDHIGLKFHGSIRPDEVENKLNHAHFFIHLTHGENFGHGIFEALAVGRPVIISGHTPWTEVVENGAGYICDDGESLKDVIDNIKDLSQEEYRSQCTKANRAAWAYYNEVISSEAYTELFSLTGRAVHSIS